MNSTLPETTDYHSSSGMSELDSLSDSDWLDIASGRDSDNDSLDDESENEGEPLSQPLSRASSSLSIGSSKGEREVEAWEGFVEQDGGDSAGCLAPGMYPMPLAAAPSAERIPLGLIPEIVTDQDRAEEELVNEALNQSLVGTLNASRTSTGSSSSGHVGSNHDLRLSFPDPLTSPRDELERSYQEVSVDEGTIDTTSVPSAAVPADLGSPPSASDDNDAPPAKADFEIHLYGASTEYKWTVVQDFLHKIADGSGQFLINTLDPTDENKPVRTAILGKVVAETRPFFNTVKIFDRTESDLPEAEVMRSDSPSLGIIFLPASRLPVMSPHTAYISVLAHDAISDVLYNNDAAARNAAEDDWDLLNIHPSQILKIRTPDKSPIIKPEDIKFLNARHVHRALQATLYEDAGAQRESNFKGQATPANAVKVITLVSVLLSIALNASSFRSSPAPTPTVNMVTPNNTWTSFASLPNRSTSVTVQATNGKAQIVVSSARDTAISIYNPGTTSLSVTPVKSIMATTSQPKDRKDSGSAALTEKVVTKEASVSIITTFVSEVSTTSSTPNVVPPATPSTEKSDTQSEPTNTAAGLNFVNSLSEVLGVTTKSIVKAVNEDGNEIMESLDEFMSVIRTQTDDLIKQSKGKARALGDQVQALGETLHSRNDRAKSRARELRKRGEELIMSASERVRDRTNVAKDRARRIHQTVKDSEAWSMYERAHSDWSSRLQEKEEGWVMRHPTGSGNCFRKREARRGLGRAREDRFMGSPVLGCAN